MFHFRKIVLVLLPAFALMILFQNCEHLETTGSNPSSTNVQTETAIDQNRGVAAEDPGQGLAQARKVEKLGRLGLEQFGYWGSAMDKVNEDTSGDYMEQVKGSSNVVFVTGFDPVGLDVSAERIRQKVMHAKDLGLSVVLVVSGIYFRWRSLDLYPDGEARFLKVWESLGSLQSNVSGFYVYDEPYGHNENNLENKIDREVVLKNLNFVADHLKSIAPQIPTISVFGPNEIAFPNFFSELVPKSLSWIGFDCYRMEGARCSEAAVENYFQKFVTVATANQQGIVLVPDAFSALATKADQYETVARLRLYKRLSASSWLVKAIYPWMYQHVNNEEGRVIYWGAESLPDVKNEIQIFYDVLKGKAHCDSDKNLTYTTGGKWVGAPACAASCESGKLTYRDADGVFYVRSSVSCN